MERIKRIIKSIKGEDIACAIKLMISLFPAMILKAAKKDIWVIAERPNNADDNGWMFYQWLKENYPEKNCYFFLNKDAHNFDNNDSHMIAYNSFKHFVYYVASDCHINAMFDSVDPNAKICNHFKAIFKKNVKTIYLKHGIIKDGCDLYKYENRPYAMFICGAMPEYEYIKENAGYPEGHIKYTGLARFDDLYKNKRDDGYILIIPTWRRYIGYDPEKTEQENEQDFLASSYYKTYSSLLKNADFIEFLEKNNLKARFCLHAQFKKYEKHFVSTNPHIEMVSKDESIHELLMTNSMMITDYSSVFFDAAYADKPVIFYHFDYEEFRSKHFSEGYFSYENDGMGPIVKNEASLVNTIINSFDGEKFVNPEKYIERCDAFFPLHDDKNCERIYDAILSVL